MDWTEEQRDTIINNVMDLCANVDRFRQVMVMTMDLNGKLSYVAARRDDATVLEAIAMLQFAADDEKYELSRAWKDERRPMSGENNDE